ncbi:hypothetical protein FA15DRAFT_602352, partial [Coprinopsis marcescibilis]
QSALVLQCLYCRRVRVQLQTKEGKSVKKTTKKLRRSNLGQVLTDDAFFREVQEQQEADLAAARVKELKKSAQERLAEAIRVWEVEEKARVQGNEARRAALDTAKAKWKGEKDEAKAEGMKVKDWKLTHPEPKLADPDYRAIPKSS